MPFVARLPQAELVWQFRGQVSNFIPEPVGPKIDFEWKRQTTEYDFAQNHGYFFSSFPSPINLSSTAPITCVPFTTPKKISNPKKRMLAAKALSLHQEITFLSQFILWNHANAPNPIATDNGSQMRGCFKRCINP